MVGMDLEYDNIIKKEIVKKLLKIKFIVIKFN